MAGCIVGILMWFWFNSTRYLLYNTLNAQYPASMSNPAIVFFTQIWNNLPPIILLVIAVWSFIQAQKPQGRENE